MSESENFNRLVVLISKGGEIVVRKLLEKYSNPLSFSDYLFNHQGTILTTRFVQNLFKPELNLVIQRDIDNMDVSLLCKLAFHLFKQNMTACIEKNIKDIRDARNELLHSDLLKRAKIEETAFNIRFRTMSDLLKIAAKEVGNTDFENEVNAFIERIESSSSLLAELYEELRKACNSNNEEVVKSLHNTMMNAMTGTIGDKVVKRPLMCMIDKFERNFERFTAGEVQETRRMIQALKSLEKANVVTLSGRAGEGKSTTAFQLVKRLCEKGQIKAERCVMLLDPKDLKHFKSSEIDLILVDDIFGKHKVDNLTRWEKYFDTLISFTQSSKKIKLITCSRKHILTELSGKLAGMSLFANRIELDSAELSEDEKRGILKAKLLQYSRDMDENEIVNCIKQNESNAGFPLIAAQCAADDDLFSKRSGYFAEPINYYLEQNLRKFDFHSLAALVCLIQNGKRLTSHELRKIAAQESPDSYLVKIARRFGIKEKPIIFANEVWKQYKYLDGTFVRVCEDKIIVLFETVSNAMSQIVYNDSEISFPVEEAMEATVSNLENIERNNTQMPSQSTQEDNNQDREKPKNRIKRFFKWLWRKIKSLWSKKKDCGEGNDRGPHDVESGKQ